MIIDPIATPAPTYRKMLSAPYRTGPAEQLQTGEWAAGFVPFALQLVPEHPHHHHHRRNQRDGNGEPEVGVDDRLAFRGAVGIELRSDQLVGECACMRTKILLAPPPFPPRKR